MIDLKDVRKQPTSYQKACDDKRISFDVAAFLQLDEKQRNLRAQAEELRAEQNVVSKQMAHVSNEERAEKREELKVLSHKVKEAKAALEEVEVEWKAQQLLIPSIPRPGVAVGKDDTEM